MGLVDGFSVQEYVHRNWGRDILNEWNRRKMERNLHEQPFRVLREVLTLRGIPYK
jgi:hypothetical protein